MTRADLSALRSHIDKLDHKLVELIVKRMAIVGEVGRYKKEHRLAPLDSKRWQEILRDRISLGECHGLSPQLIHTIFNAIHEDALKIEQEVTL